MTKQDQPTLSQFPIELRKLLSKACDAGHSDANREQIEKWLLDNQEACYEYVDFITLEALLDQRYASTQLGEQLSTPLDEVETSAEAKLGILDMLREHSLSTKTDDSLASQSLSSKETSKKPAITRLGESSVLSQLGGLVARTRSELPVPTVWFATAAALMLLAGVWYSQTRSIATVVSVEDVEWSEGSSYAIGDGVGEGWLELESGVVQLAFGNSAMVSVRGPARFQLISESEGLLKTGRLTAHVPEDAVGFTVATPDLTVVDLGTGFDMHVDDDGKSHVHVVEGRVLVQSTSQRDDVQLSAGQMVTYDRDATPEKQLRVLTSRQAVPRTKGSFSFTQEHPTSLGYKTFIDDETAHVFHESAYLSLPHEVRVNHTRPGKHASIEVPRTVIAAGTRVHSYLLHFAPVSRRKVVEGSVTFPGKILGVIGDTDMLNATNTVLGSTWTLRCFHPERGIESTPNQNFDTVTISPNRRSLSVKFQTESIDQVRVLVECDQ